VHRTATFDLQRHRSLPDHELSSPEMWHIQCKKLVSCRALGQTKFHMFTVNGQITWFNKNTQVHDNINSNYRSVSLAQYRRYSKLLAENYKIFHPTYISCPHLVCHCPNLVIAFISVFLRKLEQRVYQDVKNFNKVLSFSHNTRLRQTDRLAWRFVIEITVPCLWSSMSHWLDSACLKYCMYKTLRQTNRLSDI